GHIRELEDKGKVDKDDVVLDMLVLPPGAHLHNHHLVTDGKVFLQGKASCMVAVALCPKPGWKLSFCSRPKELHRPLRHLIALPFLLAPPPPAPCLSACRPAPPASSLSLVRLAFSWRRRTSALTATLMLPCSPVSAASTPLATHSRPL
ncbi:hypothetical protein E2562_033042, partial [Oryza meyeriana var. granulata]